MPLPYPLLGSALLLASLSAGCASRANPTHFPASSAASPAAKPGQVAVVTQTFQDSSAANDAPTDQPPANSHEGHHGHHH